jgi:hypothetical protein
MNKKTRRNVAGRQVLSGWVLALLLTIAVRPLAAAVSGDFAAAESLFAQKNYADALSAYQAASITGFGRWERSARFLKMNTMAWRM